MAPYIRPCGSDSDYLYFECASSTRPGLWHEVRVSKRFPGEVTCSCEDAVCRKKGAFLTEKGGTECRHMRRLFEHYKEILEPLKAA